MMFRAVARFILPVALVAAATFPALGQDTNSTTTPTQDSSAQTASTLGASTSLDSSSNDLASLYGTPVVEVIARVNDQVITNADLSRAQSQLAQEARQQNWSFEQTDKSQKNLLRDLIDQQLLLSKGKQLGITGDTELIKRLDDIRKQNHLASMDDLEKAVEQQGTSYEDFKANIRNNIITQQVMRQEVGSKVNISEADVRKYYEDHKDSFAQPESIHLNEIMIPTPENATASELTAAETKANEVESKLKAGASFTDMAKKYSGGPTAQEGGDLGEFKRGALAKVLEDQTFDLPINGYTQPIRTRQGYIILQVTAHNPGGVPPLQKVEPRIEETLYMQKIDPAVRQYLTKLRTEAYIDIRPGYTDSGASPDETKPTFTAYVPPQPKKKKKKHRFERHVTGRYAQRGHHAAPVSVASTAAPAAAGTASATAASSGETNLAQEKRPKLHKPKKVKLRYGQAPSETVAEQEQAASQPAASGSAASAAPATDIQPLGPDLEHTPKISEPKRHKTRFSDEAVHNKERKTAKKQHKAKVKQAKKDTAKPTAQTPAEAQNQQVQSAPLGLNGDTVHKKKKHKVKVKNGEKTRFSDEKKKQSEEPSGTSGFSAANGENGTSTAPSSQPQQ
jgi:peptidyl-prolyl cis-trans isomerase SurA